MKNGRSGNNKGKGKVSQHEDEVMENGHGRTNGDENNGVSSMKTDRGSLVDKSLACRYLAAQCLVSCLVTPGP